MPKLMITPRDAAAIQNLAEHRFLRSPDIRRLVGFPSKHRCQVRLKELREAGYIQKIERRFRDYREGGGTNPHIYALGNRGAEYLAFRDKTIWMSSRYNENNRKASDLHIDHELDVAEFMVRLELQCRERGDVELIPFYEILKSAPESTKQNRLPRQWRVTVERNGKPYRKILKPDKIFGLRDLNRPEGRNQSYFFLEIDRGTETVMPRGATFDKISVFLTLLKYAHTFNEQVHTRQYGFSNFRLLFATTTPQRVENCIAVHREHTRPRPLQTPGNLFWFTHRRELNQQADDLLSTRWMTGAGEWATLLDS